MPLKRKPDRATKMAGNASTVTWIVLYAKAAVQRVHQILRVEGSASVQEQTGTGMSGDSQMCVRPLCI